MNDFKSPHQTANRGSGAGDTGSSCPVYLEPGWKAGVFRDLGALMFGCLGMPTMFALSYGQWPTGHGFAALLFSAGFVAALLGISALTDIISKILELYETYEDNLDLILRAQSAKGEGAAGGGDNARATPAANHSNDNA